jgi:hypothetical protein
VLVVVVVVVLVVVVVVIVIIIVVTCRSPLYRSNGYHTPFSEIGAGSSSSSSSR